MLNAAVIGNRIVSQYIKDAYSLVTVSDVTGKALYDVKLSGYGLAFGFDGAIDDPEDPARADVVVVVVVVVMVVVVVVILAARGAGAAQEDAGPDGDDEDARDEGQPRIQLLGDDDRRERERHETQAEDAGRVRRGDRRPERERVSRPAAGADEVAGDERLPVTRGQGVRGTPERRDEQRDDPDERDDERGTPAGRHLGHRPEHDVSLDGMRHPWTLTRTRLPAGRP